MSASEQPFISAQQSLPELTLKAIVLAIILTVILATANVYLALKIGILTSASIPAAILSMGILRCFKTSNILENNLVQTAASAGEAVAGGIVYTIPALIIIHYWHSFGYWTNVAIAMIGGVLGVLFSIPLRGVLVTDKSLRFPEGVAIAEVLKTSANNAVGIGAMIWGGAIGALIELAQTGFKLVANSWQVWFVAKRMLFGFGAGFSATMIGAGYLIGFNLASSIMLGALLGWLISVPIVSEMYPHLAQHSSATVMVMTLWDDKVRYIGIGAMLFAGVWTLFGLVKPFISSMQTSFKAMSLGSRGFYKLPRTERDIPIHYVFLGICVLAIFLYLFYLYTLPVQGLGLSAEWGPTIVFGSLLYVLVIGFIFSAITAYFSGMVGVTASPGSAIIIAGMLIAALILSAILNTHGGPIITHQQLLQAEAITIIIGAIITGAACISNDNIQDLKVGHLVGATPWKQQVMLLLGVVVAALIIPPIMQLLYNVYGIAGVMPHAGMDPSLSMPAPPAALMAAITQAVFHENLPWDMVLAGGGIVMAMIVIQKFVKRYDYSFSILGVAVGIYLPLASTTPLFIGGVIAFLTQRGLKKQAATVPAATIERNRHRGTLLACGLVAGAALMDVALAIPFSIAHNPQALSLAPSHWTNYAALLGGLSTIALVVWFYRVVCSTT